MAKEKFKKITTEDLKRLKEEIQGGENRKEQEKRRKEEYKKK